MPYTTGFHPNAPTMGFDNALDNRQSNAGPFAVRVEFFKEVKYLFLVLCFDANAVVANVKYLSLIHI